MYFFRGNHESNLSNHYQGKEGYHKDIARLNSEQVLMYHVGMEPEGLQVMTSPIDAVRLCVNPLHYPEMVKFEVIVEEYKR